MTAHDYEAVMALADGELSGEAAERVRRHLEECEECRAMQKTLRGVSDSLQAWTVDAAPRAVVHRRPWTYSPRFLALAAGLILAVGGGAFLLLAPRRAPAAFADFSAESEKKAARSTAAQSIAMPAPADTIRLREDAGNVATGPLIVRTASLSIFVRDVAAAREALDGIARDAGGYIGNLTAQGSRGGTPSLSATLRVPAGGLDRTLLEIKKLGEVTAEAQSSDDVTQQSVDLNARLANARSSEARLKEVLEQRTGRLSDVLDVEREIARVRGEIEQMEAQRKNLDTMTSYATVAVELTAERKADTGLGPLSVSTRLRNAVVDGARNALEHAIGIVLFVATVLPTLLLWFALLAPVVWVVRRRFWVTSRRSTIP